ncbi:dTDP-4-dehydrorhamnose reductase [Haloarcula marismortui]|uniref:dTDP-4-dehydrorhamnose reductase n=1 Tax=Haloarcula marismortui ATCC 33800 TaxID=662476 RepID=M0K6E1_9EURY|nr:dTDP-4-dehydrorhamnose reductase [Haloarcula sinaiiensis]EMA16393.1 dTDP-4-dehydrorhamnose reductase [Haloarcula sinaiiensis ATCC 33800]QUJ72704.1 dTDP-4-dehydrorhamnose reductase [Haloarcula sinaiiensis ATCC 33800]
MQILVVGASGLLGGNVTSVALDRNETVVTAYHSEDPGFDCPSHQIDITSSAAVDDLVIEVDPDAIVNCAAMTDVDGCETDREQAYAVNADGAEHVAWAADSVDAALVHTSTDYVFSGEETDRYPETAEPAPKQVYGESKLAGERHVRETHPDPLITRLSFVYGRSLPDGSISGFPAWVLEKARKGDEIPLFTDQRVSPSYAKPTVKTLLDLLEADQKGTFNIASRSCVTPYEFGELVVKQAEFEDATLTESSMNDIDRDAERPQYTCLDTTAIEAALDRPQSTLAEDLADLL